MSFQACAWAVDVVVGDPIAKLVLITLAECTNSETNECFPSLKTLARRAEAHEDTVRRKLAFLEGKNLISIAVRKRENGSQSTNIYRLDVGSHPLAHSNPPLAENGGGTPAVCKGGPPHGINPHNRKTEQSVEPKSSPALPAAPVAPSEHKVFADAWTREFEAYFGHRYAFTGGKDGSAIKRMLGWHVGTAEELVAIAVEAWKNAGDRRRFFNCARATTIADFASAFVQIRQELTAAGIISRTPITSDTAPAVTEVRNGLR